MDAPCPKANEKEVVIASQAHKETLPGEYADLITKPFAQFLKIESAAGAMLLAAALIALTLANSPWSAHFLSFWETPIGLQIGRLDFTRSAHHWINDGLMTLFFFVVSLELKREFALGELRRPRAAALPFMAAIGGMAVPVAIYLLLINGEAGAGGWGTVMATDTAFVIGCLALFGSAIPAQLRIFLVSLAIFDDVGAIAVVAIGYGESLDLVALGLALLGLGAVASLAWIGIRSTPVYFLIGGMIWLCFDASGLHATITGVILGLMTPAHAWVGNQKMRSIVGNITGEEPDGHGNSASMNRADVVKASRAITESLSPLERLEMMLHPWVGFLIMPAFALANAGVAFPGARLTDPVTVAIIAGLVIGKPVGVLLFSWLAIRVRIATLGNGLNWSFLVAGAFLTGIGFTMSIFIANLAYSPELMAGAKIGILLGSAASAILGLTALFLLKSRKHKTSV